LRALNIRLIWNLSAGVLESFVPYIMLVWDTNHRILSMFPEFSYARDKQKLHDLYQPYERYFAPLTRASYVVVGTEKGKKDLVDLFGVYPDKIRVIPLPTPTLPKHEHGQAGSDRPPYVFFPGRFWPHKNHIVLVHALKLLRDRWGITLHCVFSGIDNGNLGYVMRTAEELGVRGQIEYLGNVSVGELSDLYRNAVALVYLSVAGPDNLPPLEAMSVGCPVISAEYPGAREQLGDAAMFFEPTNEAQLAECIKQLLGDAELRKTLIEKGLQRAASWTPLDYAKAVLKIIDEFALLARNWEHCDAGFSFIV
jgi:glycosyltransferase involved in cell wall biosynthesis